jgi:hypothetical protein
MTQIIKYFIFESCHVFFFSVYSDRTDMPMIFFTSVAGVILHLLNYLRKRKHPCTFLFSILYCKWTDVSRHYSKSRFFWISTNSHFNAHITCHRTSLSSADSPGVEKNLKK